MIHLVKQSEQLFPDSPFLRKQWILKTAQLTRTGKHVLYGAKVNWGSFDYNESDISKLPVPAKSVPELTMLTERVPEQLSVF